MANTECFKEIAVKDIVSESNRKHGGQGNIDILAKSIKKEGLHNPPLVVETGDGKYRIVAGRRRIEAVRSLKWKTVGVKVLPEADEALLESIALSENVNRMEMHPLDEADTFKKMLEEGVAVEEIAARFDRTANGIQHRVRLCGLTDNLKAMFREGKIALTSAALLASLPEANQERFFKKYGDRENPVGKWDVTGFIHQVQHCTLKHITDDECAKCKKRTHNSGPELFGDEFGGLEDVCFDSDCYAKKWQALIAGLMAQDENALRTENKVFIERSVPQFFPKKSGKLTLNGTEYEILNPAGYTYSKTDKKSAAKTAWLVKEQYPDRNIAVERVAYKEYERPTYGGYGGAPADPVKEYHIDNLLDVSDGERKSIAETVKAKVKNPYHLESKVRDVLLDEIIWRRIKEENKENLAALYLADNFMGGSTTEFPDDFLKELFTEIFGPEGIKTVSKIPEEPLSEKLFLFLIAASLENGDLPDIDDSEERWARTEKSLFWKFAQMSRDEYKTLYREVLTALVKEVLEEQPAAKEAEK